MPARIRSFCTATGQTPPPDAGAIARCILESLALKHAETIGALAAVTGSEPTEIHVVGGGARNELLCSWTASASGLPVLAGPAEATVLGNLLVQAMAAGRSRLSRRRARGRARLGRARAPRAGRDARMGRGARTLRSDRRGPIVGGLRMSEVVGVLHGIPAPDDRWDGEAASEHDALDGLVYRSNLLGADRALANQGEGTPPRSRASRTTSDATRACSGSRAPAPIWRRSTSPASPGSASTSFCPCARATRWTTPRWWSTSCGRRSGPTSRDRRSRHCSTRSSPRITSITPTPTR